MVTCLGVSRIPRTLTQIETTTQIIILATKIRHELRYYIAISLLRPRFHRGTIAGLVNERTNQRMAVQADMAVSPRPYIRPTATISYDGYLYYIYRFLYLVDSFLL